MKVKSFFYTVKNLRCQQIVYRIYYRLVKHKYISVKAPVHRIPIFKVEFIRKNNSFQDGFFTFLNITESFTGWNNTKNGKLWSYNINYFDFINQSNIEEGNVCCFIDDFIKDLTSKSIGLEPYPTSLRIINWVKFFCRYPDYISEERDNSLYSQLLYLSKRLEYNIHGNHLLENAFALYIGACYFQDEKLYRNAVKLLTSQLEEQTLSDGAHYEQSPMYHCILLDRLLDCINISSDVKIISLLSNYAGLYLGWLKNICFKDSSYPLFNDSAYGIAPEPKQIFKYADLLNIVYNTTPLNDSGYRKMQNNSFEVIVDIGNIMAKYQPGHSHADTFTYELRINGRKIVVDTGTSTYNENFRREYERSSIAHNCVVVQDKNSSDVWRGFRVGKRCKVKIIQDDSDCIVAYHNGYKYNCYRKFSIFEDCFLIEDSYDGEAVSYIHLAPGISPETVSIEGADRVEIIEDAISAEYNKYQAINVIKIYFFKKCKYRFSLHNNIYS